MKKKMIAILLIYSLLITYIPQTVVYAATIPTDMQTAYDEVASQRALWGIIFPVQAFDVDVWNAYGVLVLDNGGSFPSNLASIREADGTPNDYNSDVDEYRYIGKNPDGFLVNNPKYPDDNSGSAVINTYEWQENVEPQTDIGQYLVTVDDQTFYETEIFYFLETEYGTRFDDTVDPQSWLNDAIVIVPVSSTGKGVIKFMHKWDSDSNGVKEDWYITVNLRSKNEAIIEGWVTEDITSSVNAGVATLGTTRIAADNRGTESFDVTQGIPSSEDLYANVQASEYIHDETYNHVDGSITYKVTVTKTYKLWKWDEDDIKVDLNGDGDYDDPGETTAGWDSKTETVTKTYDIVRDYSFYMIDQLSVFALNQAVITNPALPSGVLTLDSSVASPSISMTRDTVVTNHYTVPISGTTHSIDLGTQNIGKSHSNKSYDSVPNEDFTADAEAGVGAIQVKNDALTFEGATLMDGGWHDASAPVPSNIPNAPLNNLDDLYQKDLTIQNTAANGSKASTGTINFTVVENTGSETSYSMPITGLNDVVVHTPVVCYPTITEDTNYIQAVDKDTTVQNLVLDRTFDIHYPNSGQHITATGYGVSDYEKYVDQKQIKLNFDVYSGNDRTGTYIAANTWFDLDKTKDDYTFFIPHWVKEGSKEILFRVIPINDIGNNTLFEYNANLDLAHYRAVESIEVAVIGQLYDLQVIGTTEKDYANMFFNIDGTNTDASYYVGNENNYGVTDSSHIDTLPIMPGKNSNSGFDKKVLKKGSAFFYSVKSAGNMNLEKDFMVVLPKFYYVDYSGNNRQEIDIWYKDGALKNATAYPYTINASLNNKYSNVSDTQINNTSSYYFDDYYSGSRTKSNYQTWFLQDETKTSKKMGTSPLIALDYEQRLYVGSTNALPAGVSNEDAIKGTQEYYGAYFIPNTARALPKGDNDLNNELKDGYIIVNFEIYTIQNFSGDTTDYHLSYNDNASSNMFSIENFDTSQGVFPLQYGDVAFYDLNKSVDTDYTVKGIY